jgi:hypothetical protein
MIVTPLSEQFLQSREGQFSKNDGWNASAIDLKKSQIVYGYGIFEGSEKIFIDPRDDSMPFWYPLDHFSIVDSQIRHDWFFNNERSSGWTLVMGYYDLCFRPSHFDGVLNREESELSKFSDIARHYKENFIGLGDK